VPELRLIGGGGIIIEPYRRGSIGEPRALIYCLVPDLLTKAYLAKPLVAFGKTFVEGLSTQFGFLLVPRGVFGPLYTPTLS